MTRRFIRIISHAYFLLFGFLVAVVWLVDIALWPSLLATGVCFFVSVVLVNKEIKRHEISNGRKFDEIQNEFFKE